MSFSKYNASARLNPQVLHIGFSKCASTYLRATFRAQPRIHLVFKSGYFTPFLAQDMTFAQYQSLFSNEADTINVESDEHLALPGIHPDLGVRSTNIEEFEAVVDRIHAHLPDVHIMMVIRNQASLIVSRYSEFLITGGSLDFEEFATRMTDDGHGRNLYYQNYYFRIIEILEKRFPRKNLLILTQEAMREESTRTSAAIASFLSLDRLHDLKKGLRSERRSLSLAGLKVLRLLNRMFVRQSSVGGAPPDTRIPLAFYQILVKAVRAIDFYVLGHLSPGSATLLTETRRLAVLTHFRDDNLKLQQYFGRELASLGYLATLDCSSP